jgi:cytochrome c biogenesis protein CcdA
MALLLSPGPLYAVEMPSLTFSPEVWKFGMIAQGARIEATVVVANHSRTPAAVTFVSTCSCLTVAPNSRIIAAGGEASFRLGYDSADDTGNTTKAFIVHTDLPGMQRLSYVLRGTVRAERQDAPAPAGAWIRQGAGTTGSAEMPRSTVATEMPRSTVAAETARNTVRAVAALTYYYTPGCRSCEEFLSTEVPRLEKELGIRIDIQRKDVLDPALYEELSSFANSQGQSIRAIPALRTGSTLLQGDQEIRAKLVEVLTSSVPPAPAAVVAVPAPLADRLAVFPVMAAGLLDGINPCAFTTLIFLLASLALAGRGRREVLVIGLMFSLAVFLTYLGIGLGLFAALRAASAVALVSVLLRWALVIVLFLFAGLSIYDYALIRGGRPSEMLLQLPSALKRQIHASIRTRVRTAALVGSSLVLGFLVSVFEFACTGQVYLPTLAYLVRVHRQLDAVGLLVLYNLCFIAPLLLVFGGSYYGVSSARITTFFQAHMGKVKLGLAVVFAGLAVFTLVG